MNGERFQRVAELFERALDLSPGEVPAFLDQHCEDPTIRQEVEALLARDAHLAEATVDPFDEEIGKEAAGALTRAWPKKIGDYRILGMLGEGGMGVVYHAEQDYPRREVALKVLRSQLVSEQMLRRFEYEAQLLGRLQHPGIAQVYEAGTAELNHETCPYIVLERIDGLPLIEFVTKKKLDTRERLQLFVQICDAVYHAHQKGIIHRDLKPQNILVTEPPTDPGTMATRASSPATGIPKILDFGVARGTDPDLQSTDVRTAVGQVLGTLPYMSPEQVGGRPDEIDTRSDVYALGVLLFELLTERLPYRFDGPSVAEAGRVIQEVEPMRLSAVHSRFRGDLDTIVAKALEKDPARRYQSASELGIDVERHLRDEPILARPASHFYQLRKFAKRHKVVVTSTVVVFATLVAGVIMERSARKKADDARIVAETAREAEEKARQEADAARIAAEEAQRSAEMVTASITNALTKARPEVGGREFTVRELVDDVAATVGERFEGRPLIEARVRETLGETYIALGHYQTAVDHLDRTVELRVEHAGDDDPQTWRARSSLAHASLESGDLDRAAEIAHPTVKALERLRGARHVETLTAMNNLASVLRARGEMEEAEQLQLRTLELCREHLGNDAPETLTSVGNLGMLYSSLRRNDEAEPLLREAMELRLKTQGERHPKTLISMNNLAFFYCNLRRFDEAQPLLERSLELDLEILGEDHPTTLACMNNLAVLYFGRKQYQKAAPIFVDIHRVYVKLLGPDHTTTRTIQYNVARIRMELNEYEGALEIYPEIIAWVLERRPRHLPLGTALRDRAVCYHRLERWKEAEAAFLEAWRELEKASPPVPGALFKTARDLAEVYEALERTEDAGRWREKAAQLDRGQP